MNASNRPIRPAIRQPRIRIRHAHALMVRLGFLHPRAQQRVWRRIACSAIAALASLKRRLDICCHPFECEGWSLVLSSRWSQRDALLVIEVDLNPGCVPAFTVAGPAQPRPRSRSRRFIARPGSRSRC